jgi:NitT/TauT family transport system permease protein
VNITAGAGAGTVFLSERSRNLRGWVLVLTLLPLWEVVRRTGAVSPLLMPPLGDILVALVEAAVTGVLLQQVAISLAMIMAGATVALAAALVTVFMTGASPTVDAAVRILGALLHPLPGIVLLPVIVLWFGIGPTAILVVIVHSVFWPVLTNLQAGYRGIPATWTMVAHNYRVTGVRYLLRIALPATAPYLLAGLRIAWARAWRALISAEMLFGAVAATGGLGWFIHSRRVFMDSAGLFAGIVAVMCVGSVVERVVFASIEQRTVRRWGMST